MVKRVASDCKKGGLYGLQDCFHVAVRWLWITLRLPW